MIRWKKAKLGNPKAILDIITPSWLKVDKAIIFFISVSTKAAIPAIVMVRVDRTSKQKLNI